MQSSPFTSNVRHSYFSVSTIHWVTLSISYPCQANLNHVFGDLLCIAAVQIYIVLHQVIFWVSTVRIHIVLFHLERHPTNSNEGCPYWTYKNILSSICVVENQLNWFKFREKALAKGKRKRYVHPIKANRQHQKIAFLITQLEIGVVLPKRNATLENGWKRLQSRSPYTTLLSPNYTCFNVYWQLFKLIFGIIKHWKLRFIKQN